MKRLSVLLLCVLVLSGCARFRKPVPPPAAAASAPASTQMRDARGAPIDALSFKLGVSSATAEKLGKQQGCSSNQGAGLVTPTGPVEVYRLRCDSGKTLLVKCEQRQCKAL